MRRDPFVGFGDETNSSVKFQVVADRGKLADWTGGEPQIVQRKVVLGGGRMVTQVFDPEPFEITLRLLFASKEDKELLAALRGQRGTLRILADISTRAGGTIETLLGTRYLKLPETLLLKVDKTITSYQSGQQVADATFQVSSEVPA